MAELLEGLHPAEFVLSEANGWASWAEAVVPAGAGNVMAAGAVVGRTVTSEAKSGNTGNGTVSGLGADADALLGRYRAVCTMAAGDGGTFTLYDPMGTAMGTVDVGNAHTNVIQFQINDGAVDFVVGDEVYILVGLQPYDPGAANGQQIAFGILRAAVDPTGESKDAVAMIRDGEVDLTALQFNAAVTDAEKVAAYTQLRARGLHVR